MELGKQERERLAVLSCKLERMGVELMEPWLCHGLDPSGGAYGFLDRRWQVVVDEEGKAQGPSGEHRGDKSLIQQSRHLFSYSLAHLHHPEEERHLAAAHQLFEFLKGHLSGGVGGAFTHQVTAQHEVRDTSVQLYAQGFAIYGLATYARAAGKNEAAHLARELFLLIDSRSHDDRYGGYDQGEDGGWLAYVGAPPKAKKCTNTHIHLLEALTPLVAIFPEDAFLSSRLEELALLIAQRLLQPAGYVHKHFALDWSPVGAPEVSYGHDLETSWLLRDALDVLREVGRLTRETEKAVGLAAVTMAEHALRCGWDELGGVYDFGLPEGQSEEPTVTGSEKVWWAQAEALPGLYRLYRDEPQAALLDQLEATLSFIKERSWDSEYADFYWGVQPDGQMGPRGDHKGEIWKTPYHALRAFLLTAQWIRADLARATSSTSQPNRSPGAL